MLARGARRDESTKDCNHQRCRHLRTVSTHTPMVSGRLRVGKPRVSYASTTCIDQDVPANACPTTREPNGPSSLAYSRRTSTLAVCKTRLRWSQACGRWLLRPSYAQCFGYPHRYPKRPLTSDNAVPPTNFQAYSPQITDDNRRQSDAPASKFAFTASPQGEAHRRRPGQSRLNRVSDQPSSAEIHPFGERPAETPGTSAFTPSPPRTWHHHRRRHRLRILAPPWLRASVEPTGSSRQDSYIHAHEVLACESRGCALTLCSSRYAKLTWLQQGCGDDLHTRP